MIIEIQIRLKRGLFLILTAGADCLFSYWWQMLTLCLCLCGSGGSTHKHTIPVAGTYSCLPWVKWARVQSQHRGIGGGDGAMANT